jgi:hypothetical protein
MALSDLTSAQLKKALELLKERETLKKRLSLVDESLGALDGQSPKLEPKSENKGRKRRKRRGAMKQDVLAALSAVGTEGIKINELAEKLKAKRSSLAVWLYNNAKKIKGLKKIGRGQWAYTEA